MKPRLLALGLLCALCACAERTRPASVPEPPRFEDPSEQILSELLMGSHGPLERPQLTRYVTRVGEHVAHAAGLRGDWQFRLSDDPAPAAQALPGGTLLVSRGALAFLSSEAELAAVLAHELAHAAQGHTDLARRALPEHGSEAAERAFSVDSDEERQADALAVRHVARAGYDPRAVGSALDALARAVVLHCRQELARDDCESAHDASDPHPARAARRARVALAAGNGRGVARRERYLRAIEGLVVGGRDVELESGRFRSSGGLSFALPAGFRPTVSGHVLTAKGLDAELMIVRLHGRFFRGALSASVRSAPFVSRQVAGHRTLIGTLGEDRDAAVAVLDDTPFVHIVAVSGTTRDDTLERVLASARPAGPSPGRLALRIVTASEPTRFGELLRRRCADTDRALALALNGLNPDAELPRGYAVKCTARK